MFLTFSFAFSFLIANIEALHTQQGNREAIQMLQDAHQGRLIGEPPLDFGNRRLIPGFNDREGHALQIVGPVRAQPAGNADPVGGWMTYQGSWFFLVDHLLLRYRGRAK
ncbi:hypothetical protein DESC_610020 [Desulfosarcina cetonica]|nr:hypothetical protein DESC_610020 [Desulfosarcina cetonica]